MKVPGPALMAGHRFHHVGPWRSPKGPVVSNGRPLDQGCRTKNGDWKDVQNRLQAVPNKVQTSTTDKVKK